MTEIIWVVSRLDAAGGAENMLKNIHKELGGTILTSTFQPEITPSYFRKNAENIETVIEDKDYIKTTSVTAFNQEAVRPAYTDLKLFEDKVQNLKKQFHEKIREKNPENVNVIPFDILAAYFTPPEYRDEAFLHCTFRIFTDLEETTKASLSSDAIEVFERIKQETGQEIKEAVQDYNKIACNSEYVQQTFKQYYAKETTVIYPGTDLEMFEPAASRENYWLSVQRLEDYKRIDIQLKAFSLMPDKKLVIVGTGEKADYVKRAENKLDNIEYLGEVSQEHLVDLYAKAQGTIQTCQIEDFGLVPIESMACGTPVIAADRGGFKETVKPEYGERIELDSKDLIEKVENWDVEEYDREELREFSQNFSKDKMVNEMKKFYKS